MQDLVLPDVFSLTLCFSEQAQGKFSQGCVKLLNQSKDPRTRGNSCEKKMQREDDKESFNQPQTQRQDKRRKRRNVSGGTEARRSKFDDLSNYRIGKKQCNTNDIEQCMHTVKGAGILLCNTSGNVQ